MTKTTKKKEKKNLPAIQMRVPQGIYEKLQQIMEEEAKETGVQRSVGLIAREILGKALNKKN